MYVKECVRKYNKNWHKNNPNYSKEKSKQYRSDNFVKNIFNRFKYKAKKADMGFDITLRWIQDRIDCGVCEATGVRFSLEGAIRNHLSPSIDRVDPTKGYVRNNCQLVIWAYNAAKNQYSVETTYNWCKSFVEKYERDNKVTSL